MGDWSATQSFEVLIDPRVDADGVSQADLEEQLAFNLQVRDALSDAQQAAARIDSTKSLLKDRLEAEDAQAMRVKEDLDEIESALVTDTADSYPPPMLINQLRYLSGMTSRADQRPGRDAYDRFEELRAELDGLLSALDQLTQRTTRLVETVPD